MRQKTIVYQYKQTFFRAAFMFLSFGLLMYSSMSCSDKNLEGQSSSSILTVERIFASNELRKDVIISLP